MRLRRFDLIRYGKFTDRSFELPAKKSDFHVVFGLNEAGKSTALAAIADLLFGIPVQSPYNFLHDYASMRIGAKLENGTSSVEVHRRKGIRDTLLDTDGSPIAGGESLLNPYLAGADRTFFERMFSLDHIRLQTGGQEILAAKDDVGQMLFSAGTGISGLRECLDELFTEADGLWRPRRANNRKFYIIDDKLKEAERILREQTVNASKWRDLKRAHEIAEENYFKVDKEITKNSTERSRLSRIRRVLPDINQMHELDGKYAELRDVIDLPEDAANQLTEAGRKVAEETARIATLQEQLQLARDDLKELTFDETLIQRSEDIGLLHERRIEVGKEKVDLPKREAELKAAEEELRTYASELRWSETDSGALIARIPTRPNLHVVRSLLKQWGELKTNLESHYRELQESREALKRRKEQLDKLGEPADVSKLAIVIRTLREKGDLSGRVRTAEIAHKDAQGLVKLRLKTLNPGGIDEIRLINMTVPAQAKVQDHRETEQDLKRRIRETQQEAVSVQQDLNGAVATLKRIARDESVPTGGDLDDARSHRDDVWQLVKLKHVQGESNLGEWAGRFEEELKDLATAFEIAMGKADDISDRRFEQAETAGQMAEVKRKIEELEMLLEHNRENETKLVEEDEHLQVNWKDMWGEAPFAPLDAESMLEWLKTREEVLEAVQTRERAQSALTSLREEEQEAREQLIGELTTLGAEVVALENDTLNVIIERATEEQRLHEAEVYKKAQLEEDVETAKSEVARRKNDFRDAKKYRKEWRKSWAAALSEFGLDKSEVPETVEELVNVADNMREIAGQISSLVHDRIEKINRDIIDFEQVVGDLVEDIAKDLINQPAEKAVFELEKRLAEAKRLQELRKRKEAEMKNLATQVAQRESNRQELIASISHLKDTAMVETIDALKEAIIQSDEKRSVKHELDTIVENLKQDGDGKSIEELSLECEGAVIDVVRAQEASIERELEELQIQQIATAEARSRAQEALKAVRGDDDTAARAAAIKQEALAEMQEVAERYVRVKTSAMLLQWAIDQYRRKKQAPLLQRASELFKIITQSSFSNLQIEYDERDNPYLTGIRPDGSVVSVSGMSTGTADQLYMALRVASVEDYLERTEALPFVADDLFINFDDERALAGFELLGELSQKTQVLFFTHHQHLVDLAQKSLGASVGIVNLD